MQVTCALEARARPAAATDQDRYRETTTITGALPGETVSPTHQLIRPAMRLTEPPTIATPNT
jgi:hypothetical protein